MSCTEKRSYEWVGGARVIKQRKKIEPYKSIYNKYQPYKSSISLLSFEFLIVLILPNSCRCEQKFPQTVRSITEKSAHLCSNYRIFYFG